MSLLTEVLASPRRLASLSLAQWDELLRLARYTRVASKLYSEVEGQGLSASIPPVAKDVLYGAAIQANHMQLMVRRELRAMDALVAELQTPVVLLKGAAYVLSGLPAANGRRMNDIDILVPREHLLEVESALKSAGWVYEESLSEYDERYYREWSHELPPLRHQESPVELDVHHNLIQTTGRIKLDSSLLFHDLVPVQGTSFYILSPVDMVLHSATHLFMSDELRGGMRDLVDMNTLCHYFSAQDCTYWSQLVARARLLGLQRPLFYAASAMRRNLNTAIPSEVWVQIELGGPSWPVNQLMQRVIDRHIAPSNIAKLRSPVCESLLYIRSHWIRMPPLMLIKHLAYKWWVGRKDAQQSSIET